MTRSLLQRILEHDYTPCRYSGRGMYGDTCLAVITDSNISNLAGDIMLGIATWANTSESLDEVHQVISDFRTMRSDTMGHQTVYYFPGVAFAS
jgi:hypothetical protein